MQDYTNIPLEFLLNKKLFERAHSVCIYATQIDRFFAETYLSLLQSQARLTIGYFHADEQTRVYLENLTIRKLSLVSDAGKFLDLVSKILISGPNSKISIITASGLTQSEFDRVEKHLLYSSDEDEFNAICRSTIISIYSKRQEFGPKRPKA